jgi:16S rRNA processing protein RimM
VTNTAEKTAFEPVILGRVSGLFGVRGWIKVFSYTDPRDAVLDYRTWWLRRDTEDWRPVTLAEGQRHGKSVIARLEGCDDRDGATAYLDAEIAVPTDALPALEEGQYYWRDLEGLEVVHEDGRCLGHVAYVMETGANDVLVIQGETERLVPFVMGDVIRDVDLAAGVIRVDWEWD